jgi:hypothetical protein
MLALSQMRTTHFLQLTQPALLNSSSSTSQPYLALLAAVTEAARQTTSATITVAISGSAASVQPIATLPVTVQAIGPCLHRFQSYISLALSEDTSTATFEIRFALNAQISVTASGRLTSDVEAK